MLSAGGAVSYGVVDVVEWLGGVGFACRVLKKSIKRHETRRKL